MFKKNDWERELSDIKTDNRDLYRSAIQISRGSDMFFKELYDDAASVGFKLAPEVKKYFRRALMIIEVIFSNRSNCSPSFIENYLI